MGKSSISDKVMGEFERNAYRRLIQHMIRSNKVASDPFLLPVPQTVAGYYDAIKNPMDLTCIRQKLDNHTYKSRGEIESDFLLMLCNAFKFNHPHNQVSINATELERSFRELMTSAIHDVNEQLVLDRQNEIETDRENKRNRKLFLRRQNALLERRRSMKDSDNPEDINRKLESLEKVLSKKSTPPAAVKGLPATQRAQLISELEHLEPRNFAGVRVILEGEPAAHFSDDGELELDLDALPPAKQRELFKYVERLKMTHAVHQQLVRQN